MEYPAINLGMPMDVTSDWYWEGNVVLALAGFLTGCGWDIVANADTHSKERGIDIHARRAIWHCW